MNPFDQFDSVEGVHAPQQNPFDQFDANEDRPVAEKSAGNTDTSHRTWGDAAKDTGRAVMKGLAGAADAAMNTGDFLDGVMPLGGLVWEEGSTLPSYKAPGQYRKLKEQGMATPTDLTGDAMDHWEQGKSLAIQQDAQYLANADGFVDTFKRAAERPRAIGNAIADSMGYMVPGAMAANSARALGLGAKGIATATAGAGALVEGGATRSEAVGSVMDMKLGDLLDHSPDYRAAVDELVGEGTNADDARKIARHRIADEAGFSAQAIAMPISFLASKLTGAAKDEADFFTGQGVKDFFAGLFRQGAEEATQETGSQFAVNVGIAENADERRKYTDDLGNAAAMGLIMGPSQQVGMKSADMAIKAGGRLLQENDTGELQSNQDGQSDPSDAQAEADLEKLLADENEGGSTQSPANYYSPEGDIQAGETLAGDAEAAPGAFAGVAEYAQQQHEQQRRQEESVRTAWMDEESSLAGAARAHGLRQGHIAQTPDQIEGSLAEAGDADAELKALLEELGHAESLARETYSMAPPGVNPFDRFDTEAAPEGLFDGIRQSQAERQSAALAAQASMDAEAEAVLQREDDQRGFMGQVARLQDQARFEPEPVTATPMADISAIYPPDAAAGVRPGKAEPRASLPAGISDQRIARPEYRAKLWNMGQDLVKGGGIGYVRDANDRITGRTPSLNPAWFKALNDSPDMSMSVNDAKAAINKALAGEHLGVRQARLVSAALDAVGAERSGYARELMGMRENARADRQQAYEQWRAATNAPVDAEFEAAARPASPGQSYAEGNYLPDNSMEDRAVAELAETAASFGADWSDIDTAMGSGDIGAQTQALTQLIWNARNEHRKPTAKQPATGAPGRPSASESTAGILEEKPANPTHTRGAASRAGLGAEVDSGIRSTGTSEAGQAIEAAAAAAATSPENNLPEPTNAQKEAGNYKKAHVKIQGLDIAIENPRGSTRSGTDPDGNAWSVTMHNHYGYLKRTEGADGDHVDVFIGPNPDSDKVFIVDQVNSDGSFDEHKVLLAFDSKLKARSGYKSNYSNGWKVGPITSMTMGEFKSWLKEGDTTKPLRADPPPNTSESKEPRPSAGVSVSGDADSKGGEPQINTPAFRHWFGDSKVVDADGKPLVVYHGTDTKFGVFSKTQDREPGDYGAGFYMTGDKALAQGYAEKRAGSTGTPVIMDLYASIKNPFIVNIDSNKTEAQQKFRPIRDKAQSIKFTESLTSQGYDGVIVKLRDIDDATGDVEIELIEEVVAFLPEQIKSATGNKGRFDPENPDIRYSLDRAAGTPLESAQDTIGRIRKAWKNPHIKIEAVANIDAMPAPVKARIQADKVANENVKAVFHNGAVYVNASAMRDAADVERAVFHEVHGHYGSRALFGRETSTAMGRLYLAIGGEKGIRDIAKKHGIDLSRYEQILKGESPSKRAEIVADELLAHIAQDSKPSVKRFLQELIGAVRTWLRSHGFPGLGAFSDSEIMALLKRTREAATELKLEGGSVAKVLLGDGNSKPTKAKHEPAYSLSGLPPKARKVIGDDPVLAAWTLLAQDDSAFQLPVSDKKTLEGIFEEIAPGVKIRRAPEFDDNGAQVWALNPKKDTLALVFQKGKSVWIDVADYSPGQSGSEIYNAVANYAYNTGKTFIGDPAGLSDKAMARRLENMISSALKFGTTDHLWPHERQEQGGAGVPPIKWKAGNDAHNLKEMINASLQATLNQFPEIQDLRYNPRTDQIEGAKDGKVYSPRAIKEIAARKRDSGTASGQPVTAGGTTLERAILTSTVSRATRQEQFNVLAAFSNQPSQRLAGLLYSLAPDKNQANKPQPSAGVSVSGDARNLSATNATKPPAFGDPYQGMTPMQLRTDAALRKLVDKMKPLQNTQKEIEKYTGAKLDENLDAYLAEELFHGKTEDDLRKLQEKYIEPLAEYMAKHGIAREELDLFLWAAHAGERNKQIAKINPNMPDGGSGMTTAKSLEVLKKAQAEGKLDVLKGASKFVYDALKHRRDLMKGTLMEDGAIDAWDAGYKFYVPLKGQAQNEGGGATPKIGRGFDIRGKESFRALGRSTIPESPVLHAIKDTTETIIRYRKNEVGNVLLDLINAHPNEAYWQVFDASNPEFERRLLKAEGKDQVGTAKVIDKSKYFTTKKDGKEYYIKLNDEKLLVAMKNMGPEPLGALLKASAKITRYLSSINTSLNPEFVISNFARDIQTAVYNVMAEQDLHDGRVKGKHIIGQMIKDVPIALKSIRASLSGKQLKGEAANWQAIFDQFREDGAKTGWYDMKDIDGQAKDLERLISLHGDGVRSDIYKAGRATMIFIDNINTAIENGVRLSVYKNAIDSGVEAVEKLQEQGVF